MSYSGKEGVKAHSKSIVRLTSPMHFFNMLHTLKLFLEIIGAGREVLKGNKENIRSGEACKWSKQGQ